MSDATLVSHTPVQLMRRWAVDYFNSHDASVAHEFIVPSYTLEIGDYTFTGRDEQWLPAVQQQMQAFPGMGMTVWQLTSANTAVRAVALLCGRVWEFTAATAINSPAVWRKKTI